MFIYFFYCEPIQNNHAKKIINKITAIITAINPRLLFARKLRGP